MQRSTRTTLAGHLALVLAAAAVATLTVSAITSAPDANPTTLAASTSVTVPSSTTDLGDSPDLPDLNDPVVRQRFVCSFGPGSFGIPPQLSNNANGNDFCRDVITTQPTSNTPSENSNAQHRLGDACRASVSREQLERDPSENSD